MRRIFAVILMAAIATGTGCDAKKTTSNAVNSVEDAAAAKAKKIENFAKDRINLDTQAP